MKDKASGPSDCLVTEVLQNLSMESVYTRAELHRLGKSYVFGKRPTRISCDRIAERSF